MLTYTNKMIHSSIPMTPYEATKSSNAIDVNKTIYLQASFTIKYIQSQNLGVMLSFFTQKTLGRQERASRFNPAIFTLNNITEQHGQKYDNVEGE